MTSPVHLTRRRLALAVGPFVLVCAALVILFAMTDDDGAPAPRVEPSHRYATAYGGLCSARLAAASGDVSGARRIFFDRSHQPLHELAAQAADRDRAAAARLLEAKEAAEAGFERASPRLVSELNQLLDAAAVAIDAVGEPVPAPCPEGTE